MNKNNLNFSRVLELPRQIKVFLMVLVDSSLCCLSIWFSYYLRLGNFSSPIEWMILPMVISTIISFFIFSFLGIYKNINRSFDIYNIVKLFKAVVIYSIFFFLLIIIFSIQNVPRTIGFIQPIIFLFLLYCIRSLFSYLLNYEQLKHKVKKNVALIYGSGNAGVQLMNSLENSDLHIEGFIDDNIQLKGRSLNGKKIHNPKDIEKLIKSKNVNQVLLAIPSLKEMIEIEYLKKFLNILLPLKHFNLDLAESLVKLLIFKNLILRTLGREEIEPDYELMTKVF